ncbi:MAG: hypothetical protein JNL57_08165 [Bacteroidetes bacterium]|nr:hypothetical protein [Bacteroidota bacterium]
MKPNRRKVYMKHAILICSILLMGTMVACKKKTRVNVIYKLKFTSEEISLQRSSGSADSLYTGFGSYITSLTPSKFISLIWMVGYADRVIVPGTAEAKEISFINGNVTKVPLNDPARIVDFSNNAVVTFQPMTGSLINNEGKFLDQQINFAYFGFLPRYFYQIVQLPPEYNGIKPDMFPADSIENNVLKIDQVAMIKKVFPNANTGWGFNFYLGNTDSTFVANPNGEMIPGASKDNPMSNSPLNSLIIRSHKYKAMLYKAPVDKETVTMEGSLSFNTTHLIQIYAGADNVPYTKDDVFVYAPRFWERISSRLDFY